MLAEVLFEKATKTERALAFLIDVCFVETVIESLKLLKLDPPFLLSLFLYFLVLQTLSGRTIGKLVLGLKIVDENGDNPKASKIFLRILLYPFSLFFLSPVHDRLTSTFVVRD